jgi:hypothetical protein
LVLVRRGAWCWCLVLVRRAARARAQILTLGQPGFERTPVRTAGNHVSQLSHCCCALSMALQVTVIDTVSALSAAFLPELQNTLQLPKLLSRTVPLASTLPVLPVHNAAVRPAAVVLQILLLAVQTVWSKTVATLGVYSPPFPASSFPCPPHLLLPPTLLASHAKSDCSCCVHHTPPCLLFSAALHTFFFLALRQIP